MSARFTKAPFLVLCVVLASSFAGCVTVSPSTVQTMHSDFLCEMLGPSWIGTAREHSVIRDELAKRGQTCNYGGSVGSTVSSPPQQSDAEHSGRKDNNDSVIKKNEIFTGSGFFVTTQGHVVTNWHVVEACSKIQARTSAGLADAIVVAHDARNDLAVLTVSIANHGRVARFRAGQGIRIGDDIVTLGYPFGELLGSSIKATAGTVSSLAGIGDDSTILQITAPIQPGNSGGPLIDLSGNVVGIVNAKLDELFVARVAGTLPQNVNFAIKSTSVQNFLEATGIAYESAASTAKMSRADVIEGAAPYMVALTCHR